MGVTKVSSWIQVPQVEKRVQRSCVVDTHERKGSEEEEEECRCPEIGAELEVLGHCKQHREKGAR